MKNVINVLLNVLIIEKIIEKIMSIEVTLFLFTYYSYRFSYIDNISIDTSIAACPRTLLICSNIVPTKMVADQLCHKFSPMPIPMYI